MAEPVDYYIAAIAHGLDILHRGDQDYISNFTVTLTSIQDECRSVIDNHYVYHLQNGDLLSKAIQLMHNNELIKYMPDMYADDLLTVDNFTALTSYMEQNNEPYFRMSLLGEQDSDWLFGALIKINDQPEQNGNTSDLKSIEYPDNDWQPLAIDRQSPEYEQSIEAAEEALKIIEGDNGYASNEPEERNAMVHTIRGTINSIKDGTPSLEQIKVGLVKPLRYLAKKFSDSAIGAAAKAAVAEIVKTLF